MALINVECGFLLPQITNWKFASNTVQPQTLSTNVKISRHDKVFYVKDFEVGICVLDNELPEEETAEDIRDEIKEIILKILESLHPNVRAPFA